MLSFVKCHTELLGIMYLHYIWLFSFYNEYAYSVMSFLNNYDMKLLLMLKFVREVTTAEKNRYNS